MSKLFPKDIIIFLVTFTVIGTSVILDADRLPPAVFIYKQVFINDCPCTFQYLGGVSSSVGQRCASETNVAQDLTD